MPVNTFWCVDFNTASACYSGCCADVFWILQGVKMIKKEIILSSYNRNSDSYYGYGIPMSMLGSECDLQIWRKMHWIRPKTEDIESSLLRTFERGKWEEDRLAKVLDKLSIKYTREIGVEHPVLRGKIDFLLDKSLIECKTANQTQFRKVVKYGVKEKAYNHWCQVQGYMHLQGVELAHYYLVNKNDCDIHIEDVCYDRAFCEYTFDRVTSIALKENAPEQPAGTIKTPPCLFCDYKTMCYMGVNSDARNCRNCAFGTVVDAKNLNCNKTMQSLDNRMQLAGCEKHRFHPDALPGLNFYQYDEKGNMYYDGWTDCGEGLPE